MSNRLAVAELLERLAELQPADSAQDSLPHIPDPLTLVRIAEEAGVPVDDLLSGKSDDCETGDLSSGAVPPPVNLVLNHPLLNSVRERVHPSFLTALVRDAIRQSRETRVDMVASSVAKLVARKAMALIPGPRNLINATGVIIHTGWGNAPLHAGAQHRLMEAAGATATGAINMPSRTRSCERLLCAVTGAEAATVTTLNAVNYALLASALGVEGEIIVAARDLIEISQGARIADLLQASGTRLVAVGSANCVYVEDYRKAITPDTAVLLRVHASNTVTSGYTAHVDGAALANLASQNELIYAENLGGGSLVDLTEKGLPWCPTLKRSLTEGADLVFASADKIIGGPQAGIVVGRKKWISKLAEHPMARICRPGKLTLAALESTLAVYLAGRAWEEIPTLRLLAEHPDNLCQRAANIAAKLTNAGYEAKESLDTAECGGAVLPGVEIPTWTVRLAHPCLQEDQLHALLLARGVVARRSQGSVLLDLRSVKPEDDNLLLDACRPV